MTTANAPPAAGMTDVRSVASVLARTIGDDVSEDTPVTLAAIARAGRWVAVDLRAMYEPTEHDEPAYNLASDAHTFSVAIIALGDALATRPAWAEGLDVLDAFLGLRNMLYRRLEKAEAQATIERDGGEL